MTQTQGKPMVFAVTGPTATGKTELGVRLAKEFDGEIVSCDSMQVYRGLPIGTAQPDAQERQGIAHHMIGVLPVTEDCSVSRYVALAAGVMEEIRQRGKLPILVGGTGLYARALLLGTDLSADGEEKVLRARLLVAAEREGSKVLHERLARLDPLAAEGIHPNNVKRVVRALAYCERTGTRFSGKNQGWQGEAGYRYRMLSLSYEDRSVLYGRIEERVDRMMAGGLLEEAEGLYRITRSCRHLPTAAQAIGYKELFPYFDGECSLETAVGKLKQASRRYAKRQMTWFRREPNCVIHSLDQDADRNGALARAGELIREMAPAAGETH